MSYSMFMIVHATVYGFVSFLACQAIISPATENFIQ